MTNTNKTANEVAYENEIHPFQRAGLGLAPFRFIGFSEKVYQACQGAPIQPGGSCAYCGQGIRYVCAIESADGQRFDVGCDCVQKIADARNEARTLTHGDVAEIARAVKSAKRAHDRVIRAKKAASVDAQLDALSQDPAVLAKLDSLPHPKGWAGKTARDYVRFMAQNAGATGSAKVLKFIRAAMAAD